MRCNTAPRYSMHSRLLERRAAGAVSVAAAGTPRPLEGQLRDSPHLRRVSHLRRRRFAPLAGTATAAGGIELAEAIGARIDDGSDNLRFRRTAKRSLA